MIFQSLMRQLLFQSFNKLIPYFILIVTYTILIKLVHYLYYSLCIGTGQGVQLGVGAEMGPVVVLVA